MPSSTDPEFLGAMREKLHPLRGAAQGYDRVMDVVAAARFALLGEGSHGTHEFYRERAEITKRLITEKGFKAIKKRSRMQAKASSRPTPIAAG